MSQKDIKLAVEELSDFVAESRLLGSYPSVVCESKYHTGIQVWNCSGCLLHVQTVLVRGWVTNIVGDNVSSLLG